MPEGARGRIGGVRRGGGARGILLGVLPALACGSLLLARPRLDPPGAKEAGLALAPRPPVAAIPPSLLRAPASRAGTERASQARAVGSARSPAREREIGATAAGEPRGEKDFYERFMAIARAAEPASFDAELRRALAERGPDCRKVAALRAAWDSGRPELRGLLLEAAASQPDVSGPLGESIPSFLVRFLGERAGRDERARAMLERIARDETLKIAAGPRERASVRLERIRAEYEQERLSLRRVRDEDPAGRRRSGPSCEARGTRSTQDKKRE